MKIKRILGGLFMSSIIFVGIITFSPNVNAAGSISQKGSKLEHDFINGAHNSLVKIDSTHYLNAYEGFEDDGQVVLFEVDTGAGTITEEDQLEFDTDNAEFNSLVQIDSTHYLNAYTGGGLDGYAVMFEVDTGAGTVTQKGSKFEFDTDQGRFHAMAKIDSTYFLNTYQGTFGQDGWAVILEVDTGTGTISQKGSKFEFDTNFNGYNSLVQIDSTHFLNTSTGTDQDGFAVILEVDTGAGTITQKGSKLEFDTDRAAYNSLVQIDSTHYLNAYTGGGLDGFAVILEVDTGAGTITQKGSKLEFDTDIAEHNSLVQINSGYYLNAYRGTDLDGFAVILAVDTGAGTITQEGSKLEFDTTQGLYNSLVQIDSSYYLNVYSGIGGDGFAVILQVDGLSDPGAVTDTIDITWAIGETISLSCSAGAVSVGAITGDGQGTIDSDTCNVRTNDTDGYTLAIKGTTKSTLDDGDTPNHTVAAYTEGTPGTPEAWSIATTESAWGVHLGSGSTTTTPLTWGADSYAGNWIGVLTSDKTIASRSDETLHAGDDEIIYFGAEVGTSKIQPSGSYTGQVTLTATTNP